MIYLLLSIWMLLAWQTVKKFPNDGPQLRGWMWFIPVLPLVYYLLTLTGLAMLFVGLIVAGFIHNFKSK